MVDLTIVRTGSVKLYSGSKFAINIAHNLVHHDRTKHMEIDRHFIKEKVEEGIINLSYVSTKFQEADLINKALPKLGFELFVRNWE